MRIVNELASISWVNQGKVSHNIGGIITFHLLWSEFLDQINACNMNSEWIRNLLSPQIVVLVEALPARENLYLEQASILIITKHPSMMENCPMQSTCQQVAGWSPEWVMQYQGLCVGLCAGRKGNQNDLRLAGHSEWKSMLLRLYVISIPDTLAPFFKSLFSDDGVAIERAWLVSENGSSYPLNY